MMQNQIALLRRELWEHRSIYFTPLAIALIVSLMSVTGQVAVSALDHVVDVAILGATNLADRERASAITVLLISVSSLFVIGLWILTIFYSLDCLYAERKDKSILFWRSIPVTDFETVLSKLLTALVVIPLITFLVLVVTHLLVLLTTSVWVGIRGANAWHLIWTAAPLFDNWLATVIFLLALPLWMSPFIGWFLLVSAYTKRSPLPMAFLPIIILPMLEKSLLGSSALADAFFMRSIKIPLFRGLDTLALAGWNGEAIEAGNIPGVSLLAVMDLASFLTHPGLWIGLIVCGLFTTAAIYVRRYRDES